jgi:hypothetical protein
MSAALPSGKWSDSLSVNSNLRGEKQKLHLSRYYTWVMASLAYLPSASYAIRRQPHATSSLTEYPEFTNRRRNSLEPEVDVPHNAVLPDDNTVRLPARENAAQLPVAGFGLYIGKKGYRIVVKQAAGLWRRREWRRARCADSGSIGRSRSSGEGGMARKNRYSGVQQRLPVGKKEPGGFAGADLRP